MKLGSLNKLNLRKIWPHEANDFTVWMSEDENIEMLLDEISISAENIVREDNAGRFSVDITADESETGKKIIIENQLEVTDHKHLGQLLTYASSFDACIIVWVVADYREEHKQAIEWFNDNMIQGISFFLVKTEVWQINDSEPAVKFNVIVEPNEWKKIIDQSRSSSNFKMNENRISKLNYWQGFKDFSNNYETKLKVSRKPKAQHWYNVSIKNKDAYLCFTSNSRDNFIGAEIYIPNSKFLFNKIHENKDKFLKILDYENCDFQPLEEKQASRIRCFFKCDPTNESRWDEYYKWNILVGEKLVKAFKACI